MFLLRNDKKISLDYPQYPLLSGALRMNLRIDISGLPISNAAHGIHT